MPGSNTQELSIVARLKDEASKQLDGLKGKFDGLSKSVKPATDASKSFALALGGAATAAAGFGVMAVKSAMEAQVEMARFETTMANIPGVTNEATQAILKRAQAVTKLGFDDEEAANVMAKLYQRTGDVNEAMRLNGLAMDLARAKGIGLSDAGQMIGMVMSGNARALKEYGIEIDDTLGPTAALGQLWEKVDGQAEAFSGTLKGQTEALQVAWGNLMETVGDQLLPMLTKLVQAAVPVVNQIAEWSTKTAELAVWLKEHEKLLIIVAGAITGALAPAILFSLIPAIYGLVVAFGAAAIALAPWIIGGALIAGVVAGIMWIVENWTMLSDKAVEIWNMITGAITEAITKTTEAIMQWAADHEYIVGAIVGVLSALVAKGFVVLVRYVLTTAIPAMVNFAITLTTQTIPAIASFVTQMSVNAVKAVASLATSITRTAIVSVISLATTIWSTVIPAIIAFGAAIALNPITWIVALGVAIGVAVVAIVKNWDTIVEKAKTMWESIKSFFKDGVNAVIGLGEGWANSWVKAANSIIGALNKIKFSIPDWVPGIGGKKFGISIPTASEVKLPRMEFGGTVPGPIGSATPIIAHGQETIIPAGKRGMGGDMNITINLNAPTFRNREDAEYFKSEINRALRDVMRVHKLSVA